MTPSTPNEHRRTAERGASMVELCLAMVVAVTILGSVLSGVLQHSSQRRANGDKKLAYAACTRIIEELRAMELDEVKALDGTGFDVPNVAGDPGGLDVQAGDPDGLPGRIVAQTDPAYPVVGTSEVLRVEIHVEWSGASGDRDFMIQTLYGARK